MNPLLPLYLAIGALLGIAAWRIANDRSHPHRATAASFWGLLALLFLVGDWLPRIAVGATVLAVALIAGFGRITRTAAATRDDTGRAGEAARLGHRLFVPALLIPAVTVVAWLVLKSLRAGDELLFEPQHATLYALTFACVVALIVALRIVRRTSNASVSVGSRGGIREAFDASTRLLESIGWAAVLPLALAMLGGLFAKAGVGDVVAHYVGAVIPVDSRFACVLAYALGMALFTMVMGNAFAAFPVMTAGVALPLLVGLHGASPAPLAAIGMLSGYCGTLLTPMAANYNIVPAALLGIDQYAVIRQQIATGIPLLAVNVVLMYFLPFAS